DEKLALQYYYDSLEPNEVITLDYFYATHMNVTEDALDFMTSAYIMQPVDSMSGHNPVIIAAVQVNGFNNNSITTRLKSCKFYIFATKLKAAESTWHIIEESESILHNK